MSQRGRGEERGPSVQEASAHHLMSIVYKWDTAFLQADDMES